MFMEERQQEIAEHIKTYGKILISEIVEKYGVSEESARRDLRILERNGMCKRTRGGAIELRQVNVRPSKKRDYEAKTIFRQGVAKGREDGISEGIKKGIISLINFLKSLNASVEQTLQALMKEYQLSQEEANKYIQEYWK